ncbi:GDP-mannose 4,6-dehydratase [Candidatus Saganbacteria bacterium]|nr:GDP-mannose 4,6-dehydratase [Candidatus Saganbacteria bacterium]
MKALITGVLGQDGSYLAEYLLAKGYQVVGIDVGSSHSSLPGLEYVQGSLADGEFMNGLLIEQRPDEIYNLGSVSNVSRSFDRPEETFDVNLLPVIRMLELLRRQLKSVKFLQASSSEMFRQEPDPPFDENSLIDPCSPYAVSKAAAYHLVKIYRNTYNLFACNAVLFNHTSPRHSLDFFVSKIVKGLVEIKRGKKEKLKVGNLDIEKDWGYAGDYVKAMPLILEHQQPDDYVIGTGKYLSLKTMLEYVLNKLNLSYNKVVETDPTLIRPNEPKRVYSDPSKIMMSLGWRPEKSIEQVLDMMIEAEMEKQGGK